MLEIHVRLRRDVELRVLLCVTVLSKCESTSDGWTGVVWVRRLCESFKALGRLADRAHDLAVILLYWHVRVGFRLTLAAE